MTGMLRPTCGPSWLVYCKFILVRSALPRAPLYTVILKAVILNMCDDPFLAVCSKSIELFLASAGLIFTLAGICYEIGTCGERA